MSSPYSIHLKLLIFLLFSVVTGRTQTVTEKQHPVLPQKKSPLKIIFDDSQAQLIGIDTNGNVMENAIVAFQLMVRIKGVNYSEQALGSFLNKGMQELLAKADQTTILYFEHIQVKNASGNLVEAEAFQYTRGYPPEKDK